MDLPPLDPIAVRVRVRASGINFPDTLIIQGKYQLKPDFPFAPGFEVAGEIIETGADVTGLEIGTRVVGLTAEGHGGFAEYADIRAAECVSIPPSVDDVTAVASFTAYGTAYHALIQRGSVSPGETVAVLGATGGVGLAAVDIASALGAQVIAVASSQEKLELARRAGATETIVYEKDALGSALKQATGGRGIDVCVDLSGGSAFAEASRAMAWGGRMLVIGFTSGAIPSLPVNLLLLKGYSAVGVYWGRFCEIDPAGNAANFRALWQLMADGRIAPHVHRTYPMDETVSALDDLLSRRTAGKLVLTPFAQ